MWSTFSRGVQAFILQGSLSVCLAEINYVWQGIETLTAFGRRIETFKHLAGELSYKHVTTFTWLGIKCLAEGLRSTAQMSRRGIKAFKQ